MAGGAVTGDANVVRLATAADAPAIAAIYNEGIDDRLATFETDPRTPEGIAAQLAGKGDRYPTASATTTPSWTADGVTA